MNLDFKKLFVTGKATPPVRVRTLRAMVLTPLDEPSRHVDAGEEVLIDFGTFQQLERGDYDMLDSGVAPVEVTDPTPPRQTAAPLPARWDELPKCFADYWDLTEDFRTAREHVSEIIAARTELFGSNFKIGNQEGTALVGGVMSANNRKPFGGGMVSTLKPINLDDPKLRKLDRLLTASEENAREFYNRLIDTKEIAIQRAFLACGQHRLKIADELRVVIDELSQIGLELFAARTAALGLADFQVRRLYHGSADFLKFGDQAPAISSAVSSAGLDSSQQPILYSDAPAASQAGWSLSMADRLVHLRPLLAEGQKALAKARKALLPAGLPA
jgi:hypothetical protein